MYYQELDLSLMRMLNVLSARCNTMRHLLLFSTEAPAPFVNPKRATRNNSQQKCIQFWSVLRKWVLTCTLAIWRIYMSQICKLCSLFWYWNAVYFDTEMLFILILKYLKCCLFWNIWNAVYFEIFEMLFILIPKGCLFWNWNVWNAVYFDIKMLFILILKCLFCSPYYGSDTLLKAGCVAESTLRKSTWKFSLCIESFFLSNWRFKCTSLYQI